MQIVKANKNWTMVDDRWIYVGGSPGVILTAEESLIFMYDDALQEECRKAAEAAGLRGLIPCHTIGGYMPGTVEVL